MNDLTDLYRNITFLDEYDEQSFMHLWMEYSTWSDEEYWKLDKALNDIKKFYPYPVNIPRDISAYVARITQFMMMADWRYFSINGSDINDGLGISIRYERLKSVLRSIYTGEELDDESFAYRS